MPEEPRRGIRAETAAVTVGSSASPKAGACSPRVVLVPVPGQSATRTHTTRTRRAPPATSAPRAKANIDIRASTAAK